ncbi:hypothetical protein Tco_0592866 [Tanacetum coccineum]
MTRVLARDGVPGNPYTCVSYLVHLDAWFANNIQTVWPWLPRIAAPHAYCTIHHESPGLRNPLEVARRTLAMASRKSAEEFHLSNILISASSKLVLLPLPRPPFFLLASAFLFLLLGTWLMETLSKPSTKLLVFSGYLIILSSFAMYVPRTWFATSLESTLTCTLRTSICAAIRSLAISASYSASLLEAGN